MGDFNKFPRKIFSIVNDFLLWENHIAQTWDKLRWTNFIVNAHTHQYLRQISLAKHQWFTGKSIKMEWRFLCVQFEWSLLLLQSLTYSFHFGTQFTSQKITLIFVVPEYGSHLVSRCIAINTPNVPKKVFVDYYFLPSSHTFILSPWKNWSCCLFHQLSFQLAALENKSKPLGAQFNNHSMQINCIRATFYF